MSAKWFSSRHQLAGVLQSVQSQCVLPAGCSTCSSDSPRWASQLVTNSSAPGSHSPYQDFTNLLGQLTELRETPSLHYKAGTATHVWACLFLGVSNLKPSSSLRGFGRFVLRQNILTKHDPINYEEEDLCSLGSFCEVQRPGDLYP